MIIDIQQKIERVVRFVDNSLDILNKLNFKWKAKDEENLVASMKSLQNLEWFDTFQQGGVKLESGPVKSRIEQIVHKMNTQIETFKNAAQESFDQ